MRAEAAPAKPKNEAAGSQGILWYYRTTGIRMRVMIQRFGGRRTLGKTGVGIPRREKSVMDGFGVPVYLRIALAS